MSKGIDAIDEAIAQREREIEALQTARAIITGVAAAPLGHPARGKTGGNRAGGKKTRKPPSVREPDGEVCDLSHSDAAVDDPCDGPVWASRPCKKCERVTQRCAGHGGADATKSAARHHAMHCSGRRHDDETTRALEQAPDDEGGLPALPAPVPVD